MTKYTIELPDEYVVGMRNGASLTVVTKDISPLLAEFLGYGIGQKFRDAASAATTRATENGTEVQVEAQAMMDNAYKAIVAGEWSHRGDGTGADPRTVVARSVVRKYAKAKVGAKSPEWAAFTGLSTNEQNAKLDANYEANKEVFDPLIDAELKRRADANKAKSKIAGSITVNL